MEIGRRELLAGATVAAMVPGAARAAADPVPRRAKIRAAAEAGKDANVKRLQDWIRHPGIAAEKWQMPQACDYTMSILKDAGFQMVKKIPTSGEPGIFATLDAGARRTLGIYFMYDVKQVNPAEWSTPPFEAAIIDKPGHGRVVQGRGAVNQKGPQMAFLGALYALKDADVKPPVNLVLVAEGEEEIASPNFHEIVAVPEVLGALKKADGIVIPSAWQGPNGAVNINLGAKGPLEFQLISSGERWGRGPKGDIHSSNHAMVDSPVWRLVQALNTLVEADGHTPAIDGWFENVRPLTPRERFEALFDLLSSPGELLTTDRLGRKTELQQRMRDGSLESICLVIRDLYTQRQTARLNEADNITLNRARKFLLEEWRLVMGISMNQAEAQLKELLETGLAKYRQQTA
jgi:acetylornithine deacetylase/succinyl-diaminopimelate desuccinylase-like protein